MVTNTLVDVAGLQVGHADLEGEGALSGTTVVLPGPEGAVAGVDVRGGGPGTRETDALDPRTLVERVHAVVLTGGSAYGLAAASGVADALGRGRARLPGGARARRGRARRARRRGLRPRSRRPVRGPPDRGDRARRRSPPAPTPRPAQGVVGAGTRHAHRWAQGRHRLRVGRALRRHDGGRARGRERGRLGGRPVDRRAVGRPAPPAGRRRAPDPARRPDRAARRPARAPRPRRRSTRPSASSPPTPG